MADHPRSYSGAGHGRHQRYEDEHASATPSDRMYDRIPEVLGTPVVLWCGWPFLLRGWNSFRTLRRNMFLLIGTTRHADQPHVLRVCDERFIDFRRAQFAAAAGGARLMQCALSQVSIDHAQCRKASPIIEARQPATRRELDIKNDRI